MLSQLSLPGPQSASAAGAAPVAYPTAPTARAGRAAGCSMAWRAEARSCTATAAAHRDWEGGEAARCTTTRAMPQAAPLSQLGPQRRLQASRWQLLLSTCRRCGCTGLLPCRPPRRFQDSRPGAMAGEAADSQLLFAEGAAAADSAGAAPARVLPCTGRPLLHGWLAVSVAVSSSTKCISLSTWPSRVATVCRVEAKAGQACAGSMKLDQRNVCRSKTTRVQQADQKSAPSGCVCLLGHTSGSGRQLLTCAQAWRRLLACLSATFASVPRGRCQGASCRRRRRSS